MTTEATNTRMKPNLWLLTLLLLGLLMSSNTFAGDMYRVSAQVIRLGQVIAQPLMIVEEGQTTGATYTAPDKISYKFVVLVRAAGDDQVSISLQYTSGNVHLQPNLLVDIDKPAAVTIDKTRMTILVERASDQPLINASQE